MNEINILLIEDNEGDILLTLEAFEESKIVNNIKTIKDGKLAINYLESISKKTDAPHLILLDINLPKINGHEVLTYIKNDDRHKRIPVIMLTTSSSQTDILKSYNNHANCYITKPVDVSDFMAAIAKIQDFWMNIVSIPVK